MMSEFKNIAKRIPLVREAAQSYFRHRDEQERQRYLRWLSTHRATDAELEAQRISAPQLSYRPLMSIVVPTYNTPSQFLDEMIASVLAQTYDNWELVIVDDASPDDAVRERIQQHAAADPRIRYTFLATNHHIAGATNQAIKMASGEFISLFDHDDILWPAALYEIVSVLNEGEYDFVYTDEDKVTQDQHYHMQPLLKPSWNQDFMYAVNYVTHFTTLRKSVLDAVGGEDSEYDGAQDWELFLRVARTVPVARIRHIPKILYSWRVHAGSTAQSLDTKPYVIASQQKAIETDLKAKGQEHSMLERDQVYSGQWQIQFTLKDAPRVIIVTAGNEDTLRQQTSYGNLEITNREGLADIAQDEDYVVFIGNHFHVQDTNWVSAMLADATREDIGFVVATREMREQCDNLVPLLGQERAEFVRSLSGRQVSKHLYTTARYNLAQVRAGTCMISVKKLRKVVKDLRNVDIAEASTRIAQSSDTRNLYNPYVKC